MGKRRHSGQEAAVGPVEGRPLGVYVHYPFCLHVCPYCDFKVVAPRTIPHEAYLEAVLGELRARAARFEGARLVSIYLGGGTPGLWPAPYVGRLLEAVRASWPLYGDPQDEALAREIGAREALEVTVEINPAQAPRAHLEALREAGVNRLSVGVQSFDDAYLARLGRDHGAQAARETLLAARDAGFGRLSFDLIFGGPDQDMAALERDLAEATAVGWADHVSVYEMTIEPKTPFGRRHARGELRETPEPVMAQMFAQVGARLGEAGYLHYEIGSHARPGRYARHNALYWRGAEYMGLGVGAHELAFVEGAAVRRRGPSSLRAYMADPVHAGAKEERLSWEDHLFERAFVGLRTRFGVSRAQIEAQFGPQGAAYIDRCAELLTAQGYLTQEAPLPGAPGYLLPHGERLVPTARAMMQADSVALLIHPSEILAHL